MWLDPDTMPARTKRALAQAACTIISDPELERQVRYIVGQLERGWGNDIPVREDGDVAILCERLERILVEAERGRP